MTISVSDVLIQLAPDQGMVPADHPTELRRRCEEEAQQMVQLSNSVKDGQQSVTNTSLSHLISRLTALLLQIKVENIQHKHYAAAGCGTLNAKSTPSHFHQMFLSHKYGTPHNVESSSMCFLSSAHLYTNALIYFLYFFVILLCFSVWQMEEILIHLSSNL